MPSTWVAHAAPLGQEGADSSQTELELHQGPLPGDTVEEEKEHGALPAREKEDDEWEAEDPKDAKDSAPFRAPEDEGFVTIRADRHAAMRLLYEAGERSHTLLGSAGSSSSLQAKAPQQRQQQQQQQPPGQGAPWAPSVTRVTATRDPNTRSRADRRAIGALNLEPGKDGRSPWRLRAVHALGKGPKGP